MRTPRPKKAPLWAAEIYVSKEAANERADEIRSHLSTLQSVRVYARTVRVDGERLQAHVLIARVKP